MAEEKSLRYRVNIDISAKGVKKWECTVDGTGYSQDEILMLSDGLVKRLEERYPIKVDDGS